MQIWEFVEKLRALDEKKKKAIIIVVVCILAFVGGFWWVKSSLQRLDRLGEATKDIKLPAINMPEISLPDTNLLNTVTPSNSK